MASTISAGTTSGTAIAITGDTSGSLALQTNGTTTAVTIDTSQNVGIGTSSPTAKLNVSGTIHITGAGSFPSTGVGIELVSSSVGGTNYIQAYNRTGSTWQNLEIDSAQTVFGTGGSERMRIDSSGRVLVNATSIIGSDTAPFQVTGGSVTAVTIKGGSNNYFQAFYNTSNTLIGSITGSSGSTTAYNTTSDYRLKENVAPITGALAKVSALKPVTYTWKTTGEKSQGFIAHELAEIVPDCVTGEKDAVNEDGSILPQGIDTSFLIATLTAAIQELNAKVTTLEAQLGVK
jgi:hypothetical protein